MNVLGISAHYHDASAAMISNGKVIAAAAEERFTRQKHDPNFPRFAIEFCLNESELVPQDVDTIVFYEEPHIKFTRILSSSLAPYPFSRSAFVKSMKDWLGLKLWTKNEISKKLNVHPNKIEFISHHKSHAAQAFIGSPFKEAAILTIDAVGEWGCTSLYTGRWNGKAEVKQHEVIPFPHSLGLVYAAFTAFLGFRVNDGEANIMALAAFGKPTFADEIRRIIKIQEDGTYFIDQSYFTFNKLKEIPYSRKFVNIFGIPRNFYAKLPFHAMLKSEKDRPKATKDSQRFADIAASIQLVLEETLFSLCNKLYEITGFKNLCFSGGVALNCVANSKILNKTSFENLFIPPDPGDGGGAIGAALYWNYTKNRNTTSDLILHPYLGKQYDESRDAAMLEYVKPNYWLPFIKKECHRFKSIKLDFKVFDHFEKVIPCVIEDLSKGKIIGWFQGRFEIGPRALGNRSILVDPKNINAAKKLSENVKDRASFRPYAFSITKENAGSVLERNTPLSHTTKWMQVTEKVKDNAVESVRAAVHIDGTTRPQVCSREDNPRFHQLLSSFGEISGVSALLNTSFNESGYPIVGSPIDALLTFARTDIDTIIINNLVVRKLNNEK